MNTHAAIDEHGNVDRICTEDAFCPPGHSLFKLEHPVAHCPPAPFDGAALVFANGALVWRDTRTSQEALADIRTKRDNMLAATDWMVTKALETGEPMPPAWATYRQALRDITKQTDLAAITWPTPPETP